MSSDKAAVQSTINWYRIPISRALSADLNQRSDISGFAQTLGHLGIICVTAVLSWYASLHSSWPILIACLFLHGTVYAFLLNAFHEFCHGTVFKTRLLNRFFLYLISFVGGLNHVYFWDSHQEHHKYTLHQPDDLEVILPFEITLKSLLTTSFVNPRGFIERTRGWLMLSMGRLEDDWQRILFPDDRLDRRHELFSWARILVAGHSAIVFTGWYTSQWMLPVLITFAPFYGGLLLFLCNNTQHVGLQDEVSDYRLCTRTIYLNPVVEFLYWHMNYHIEHHMHAAVPCYKLARLHRAIKHELPYITYGLIETWSVIITIIRRQNIEPTYQFVPKLPPFTEG